MIDAQVLKGLHAALADEAAWREVGTRLQQQCPAGREEQWRPFVFAFGFALIPKGDTDRRAREGGPSTCQPSVSAIPRPAYATALGDRGIAAYRKAVAKEDATDSRCATRPTRQERLACPHGLAGQRRPNQALPPRPLEEHHVAMEHDDITSAELDDLLDTAETIVSPPVSDGTEVRLFVTVDAATLHRLEQRAQAEGTDVTVVAADTLRAATHAA